MFDEINDYVSYVFIIFLLFLFVFIKKKIISIFLFIKRNKTSFLTKSAKDKMQNFYEISPKSKSFEKIHNVQPETIVNASAPQMAHLPSLTFEVEKASLSDIIYCRCSTTSCKDNRCSCFKNRIECNDKCHKNQEHKNCINK